MFKLSLFLLVLIAALQYRLWLGDGGIREYQDTMARIEGLKREGERLRIRNAAVAADVRDLREGTEAVEERARWELGMIKPGETFVQVYESAEEMPKPVEPKADVSWKPGARPRRPAAAPPSGKAKPAVTRPARKPAPKKQDRHGAN